VLQAWRTVQLQDRLWYGAGWTDTGRVFTAPDGRALHPAVTTRIFEWASFDAGLPPIRLHNLRHSAATLGFAAGMDIEAVSAMMRHSSITITADIYTSVLDEAHAEMAERMTGLVPRRKAANSSETGGRTTVAQLPWKGTDLPGS
jgi:integrase